MLAAILFGSAGIIIKFAFSEGTDSVDLLILQYIMAVVLMAIFILVRDRNLFKITLKDIYRCAVLGVVGNTFMTVFYYMAFSYLQVSMVAILLYTYPVMVFMYSALFEKTKVNINKTIAMLMAFIGCFLSLGFPGGMGNLSAKGLMFGLLAAVFFAFMNIYSGMKLSHIDSLAINFYSTAFSLIALIIYKFPMYILRGEVSGKLIFFTLILSLICEIIPLTLLYAAVKKIGSLKTSIIGNLEIPTAMILGFLCFNQHVSLLQICGAGMVAFAVYKLR